MHADDQTHCITLLSLALAAASGTGDPRKGGGGESPASESRRERKVSAGSEAAASAEAAKLPKTSSSFLLSMLCTSPVPESRSHISVPIRD